MSLYLMAPWLEQTRKGKHQKHKSGLNI
uniref:Uncharacterized protein n=1 Tax=Rhizophora mucronata TaxID=61149 RepID=A0A2P2QBW3_RHIMU